MSTISFHKCLSCPTFIEAENDFCESCTEIVECDLAIHDVLVAMARLREQSIAALSKRWEILKQIKGEIDDIHAEIEASQEK